jgi:hypothetical protein
LSLAASAAIAASALPLTRLPSLQTNCGCAPYQAARARPTSGSTRRLCVASAAQPCAKGDGGAGSATASSGAAPVVSDTGGDCRATCACAVSSCEAQIVPKATVFNVSGL